MSDTTELLPDQSAGDSSNGGHSGVDAGTQNAVEQAPSRPRRRGGLASMLLPELQEMAAGLGITGTAKMRKSQLIEAIQERQSHGGGDRSADSGERGRSNGRSNASTEATDNRAARAAGGAARRPGLRRQPPSCRAARAAAGLR